MTDLDPDGKRVRMPESSLEAALLRDLHTLALAGILVLTGADSGSCQMRDPEIGAPAPAFTLPDTHGSEHNLADYAGRWVVLEWLSYECPFVGKHYDSGNMQRLQSQYRARDVVWFSIVSSAPGEQGYYEPEEMNRMNAENRNNATAVLLDPEGTVGLQYGAKTTPQMYLIDPEGVLLYNGALDDRPTSLVEELEGATNYLDQAMAEAMAGNPVSLPTTQPYGCSVKYRK
jgi:cytochrome oxidase Cu insertion factor (SCO1/SenC/PrrC family)